MRCKISIIVLAGLVAAVAMLPGCTSEEFWYGKRPEGMSDADWEQRKRNIHAMALGAGMQAASDSAQAAQQAQQARSQAFNDAVTYQQNWQHQQQHQQMWNAHRQQQSQTRYYPSTAPQTPIGMTGPSVMMNRY